MDKTTTGTQASTHKQNGPPLGRPPGPSAKHVGIYFSQRGVPEPEAETFLRHYQQKNWTSQRGTPFKTWQPLARRWISSLLSTHPWLFNRNNF